MHSYRLESFGSLQGLKLIEEQRPVPGRNQVLIKVRACSLNYRDLAILYGTGTLTPKAGLIPLSDGAGEVVATGDSVSLFKKGDRVVGTFFPHWWSTGCRCRERNLWHSGRWMVNLIQGG
ncbi:alcohol dehydrogenase catalytic domain-containing protein [Klebsiella pneumoniae]|nr:alcohol dehydrogenase catalytic domain-containing protein [Klebsiella pneumoniae]